jgi:hypothetical protein
MGFGRVVSFARVIPATFNSGAGQARIQVDLCGEKGTARPQNKNWIPSLRWNDERLPSRVGNASTSHGSPHCVMPPLVQFFPT